MSYFFITGLYRSGTTLLEKLLENHQDVFAANQPLPNLYYHVKQDFNNRNNIKSKIILNTLFNETNYKLNDFKNHLNNSFLDRNDFRKIFDDAKKFSGVKSPEIFNIEPVLEKNTFANVYKQMCDLLLTESEKKNVKQKGTKEILGEEYIDYLIENNIKVILIVRDIRDVINSLNYGKGNEFTGNVRPTLFNIRNWRKSVAFSIKYKNHSNFYSLKYEDLVSNPDKELQEVSAFLQISKFSSSKNSNWTANSSFENYSTISSKSIGKYKEIFSFEYIRYIEKLCFPELHYLNYDVIVKKSDDISLSNFREPVHVNHHLFDTDYSLKKINIANEKIRMQYLEGKETEEIERFFIFKQVAEILKRTQQNAE